MKHFSENLSFKRIVNVYVNVYGQSKHLVIIAQIFTLTVKTQFYTDKSLRMLTM